MGQSWLFSIYWLLIPLVVGIAGAVLLVLWRGRRSTLLAAFSAIFFAMILVIWALSYKAGLAFHAEVGEYAKDHYDKRYIFLMAWNGEIEFVWGTHRFIGPRWQERVEKGDTRYLGDQNLINIVWSPDMVKTHPGSGLPLMQPRPAPKRDNWWARYVDWRVERFPLPYGMGLSPVHINIRFKLWFLFLPLSFFPVLWLLRKYRERRRRKAGHCVRCNYDLRGTPEKCRECGMAVKKKWVKAEVTAVGTVEGGA